MRAPRLITIAAVICLAGLAVAVGINPLSNNDIWLHLTTGKLILERAEIPRVDDYSFTRAGAPYVAHEWLAQTFFWLVFRSAGVTGLILLKPLVLLITALLLWRASRRLGAGPIASLWAAVLAVVSMTSHLFVRPHLFSFMMIAATTLVLIGVREGRKGSLPALAGIQLVWANLHGGFILGIALALSGLSVAAAGIGALVSLANPYGAGLYRFVLVFAEPIFRKRIREWASPFEEPFFGSLHFWFYTVVLVLVAAAVIHHARARRWAAVGPLLLFTALSFSSKRHVSLLAVVAAPWLALAATQLFERVVDARRSARTAPVMAVSCLLIAALACTAALVGVPHETGRARLAGFGIGENVPVAALDYVTEKGISGYAFNSLGFGSYVTWRSWPSSRVFIDSRLDVYGGPFLEQYSLAMEDASVIKELLGRYRLDYAVISYRLEEAAGAVSALSDNPDWALVHYDDIALVYLRRQPRWSAVIARDEYQLTNPAKFLAGDLSYSGRPEEALDETRRALARCPGSALVTLMQGTALAASGRHAEAVSALEQAASRLAADAGGRDLLYGLLGTSYLELGEDARAEAAFQRLVAVAPDSVYGRRMLEEIRGRRKRAD